MHRPVVRADRDTPGDETGAGTDQLSVSFGRYGETVVLSATGDVDLYTAPLLMSMLRKAIDGEAETVVVDLTAVGFLDSTGLAALVTAQHRAERQQCRLRLAGGTAVVLPLETAGLRDWFELYPSAGDAARATRRPA